MKKKDEQLLENYIDKLPQELLELILDKLSFKNVLLMRTVNKKLCEIISTKYKRFCEKIPYFLLIPTNSIKSIHNESSKIEIVPTCKCNIYGSYNLKKIISLKYPSDGVVNGIYSNVDKQYTGIICCHNYVMVAVKNKKYFHLHINCNYISLYDIFDIDFNIISIYDKSVKYDVNLNRNNNELMITIINGSICNKLINIVDFSKYNNDVNNYKFTITQKSNVKGNKIYKFNIIKNNHYSFGKSECNSNGKINMNSDDMIYEIINI